MKQNAFLRRRAEVRKSTSRNTEPAKSHHSSLDREWLRSLSHAAQISLAVTAIIGYVFTVRPIYQKERLAEEVARLEQTSIDKEKEIEASRSQLASLSEEIENMEDQRSLIEAQLKDTIAENQFLAEERISLADNVSQLTRQTERLKQEQADLEQRAQYLAYRLINADGTSADTPDEIVEALKRMYLTTVPLDATFSALRDYNNFTERDSRDYLTDLDQREIEFGFPFEDDDLEEWNSHDIQLPREIAKRSLLASAAHLRLLEQYPEFLNRDQVDRWQSEALSKIQAMEVFWTLDSTPTTLARQFSKARAAIIRAYEDDFAELERTVRLRSKEYRFARSEIRQKYSEDLINLTSEYSRRRFDVKRKVRDISNQILAQLAPPSDYDWADQPIGIPRRANTAGPE